MHALPSNHSPHSFTLSSIHFDNEFELQTEFAAEWKKRKEKKRVVGGRGYFLALSFLSDLMTLHWARQPSLPLPLPLASSTLDILSYKTINMFNFLSYVTTWIWLLEGETRESSGHKSPHLTLLCLIYLFYTLHSSTDGLSIDFDLSCLGLASWACGCLSLVGVVRLLYWLKQHWWIVTISLVWLSKCKWIWIKNVSIKSQIQLFQIILTAVAQRQSKLWQEDFKAQHKIKWLVNTDMFCSVFFQ